MPKIKTERAVEYRGRSRRHNSAQPNRDAREFYQSMHGPDARRVKAQFRANTRGTRTAAVQLAELDARLGMGVGATKERARLAK